MITEQSIRNALAGAKARGGSVELKDPGARGEGRLTLIVRAGGSRLVAEWYVAWWTGKKRRSVKIGTHPTLGLSQARVLFRDEYAALDEHYKVGLAS